LEAILPQLHVLQISNLTKNLRNEVGHDLMSLINDHAKNLNKLILSEVNLNYPPLIANIKETLKFSSSISYLDLSWSNLKAN
jgi:hypothetical protein